MTCRSGLVSLAVALLAAVFFSASPAGAAVTLNIDGASVNGRPTDGVGVISAGGESRLLEDYRDPQFTEILDFAFCSPVSPHNVGYCAGSPPKYGEAAQELKVEIGGDGNSSVGTEASFLRSQAEYDALRSAISFGDTNAEIAACHLPTSNTLNSPTHAAFWGRGYNWRLMREAKFRNNEITFGALQWTYPQWLDDPTNGFWGQPMRNYLLAFAFCANLNGTPLDNLGIWNEVNFTTSPNPCPFGPDPCVPYSQLQMDPHVEPWLIALRSDLDNSATSWGGVDLSNVRIVCCDEPGYWDPLSRDMIADNPPGIRNAVAVINPHYTLYASNPDARTLFESYGKLIWAGEVGGLDGASTYLEGARNQATFYERPYIEGAYTGIRMVAPFGSYLRVTDNNWWNHPSNGMIQAEQPWSGYYYVPPAVWAMAQFTQFTKKGSWRYIDESSCEFDASEAVRCAAPYASSGAYNVSYATLREISDGNGNGHIDWSTIIETTNATASHTFNLCPINGAYAPATVNLWSTDLTDTSTDASWFVKSTLSLSGGCYSMTLNPQHIYTVTTLTTGAKGTYTAPAARPIDRPDLDGTFTNRVGTGAAYNDDETPEYFSDMNGAFEIRKSGSSYATGCPTTDPCLEMIQPAYGTPESFTLVGQWDDFGAPNNWCNYSTQVDVKFPVSSPYPIGGLMMDVIPVTYPAGAAPSPSNMVGYEFRIDNASQWELKLTETGGTDTVLETGTFSTPADSRGYHTLKLTVVGTTVTPYIDGVAMTPYTDTTARNCGLVGLSTNGQKADFDDLVITPNP